MVFERVAVDGVVSQRSTSTIGTSLGTEAADRLAPTRPAEMWVHLGLRGVCWVLLRGDREFRCAAARGARCIKLGRKFVKAPRGRWLCPSRLDGGRVLGVGMSRVGHLSDVREESCSPYELSDLANQWVRHLSVKTAKIAICWRFASGMQPRCSWQHPNLKSSVCASSRPSKRRFRLLRPWK